MQYRKGMLVRSLSGRDKDRLYIILEEGQNDVLVSDGSKHGLSNPKRKNKKHVQLIKRIPDELAAWAKQTDIETDKEIITDESIIRGILCQK